MAEWIIVGLTAIGTIAAIGTVLIKVAVALSKNTDAIERLTDVMDKQDARISLLDEAVDDHEGRIVAIETIHRLRHCDQPQG